MSEAGSGIEGFLDDSAFARFVAERLKKEDFKLIDVGCAGGVARGWRALGDRLAAVGFDTNAPEVERLNAVEKNPKVRYVAGWVGLPDDHPLRRRIGSRAFWHHWAGMRLAYERTLFSRKTKSEGNPPPSTEDYFRDQVLAQDWSTLPPGGRYDADYADAFTVYPPSDAEIDQVSAQMDPERTIHLPPYLKSADFYDADFLKIDIDGPDYEVLRSLTDLLAQPTLLGVSLEVSFFGSHDANDNTFHNVDRLMREKGFELFGLSVRTYASAALPFPYLDAHPSMNAGGRAGQGDALYVRDLGSRILREQAAALSDEKLAKAAVIFALFTLPDYAAEILIAHRDRLSRIMDVDKALDVLTKEIQRDHAIADDYQTYMEAFRADDSRFYNLYDTRNAWMRQVMDDSEALPQATDRADAAEQAMAEARQALDDERRRRVAAEAALEAAQSQISAITSSNSWRLTGPLRRFVAVVRPGRRGAPS